MNYIIDEILDIDVNNDKQNIHIRTNNSSAPVLLFVHGGPGVCDRSWVMPIQSKWLAEHFIMVCWDQRMAGKSYRSKNKNNKMNLSQQVEDLRGVTSYLNTRFNQEKIFIVGHSWGTVLSCLYLQKYSDNIRAYVGMGQFINGDKNEKMSYDFVYEYAKDHNDTKAIKDLEKIGSPVEGRYKNGLDDLMVQRNYMTKFGGGSYKEKENIFKSVLVPFFTSKEYSVIPDLYRYYNGTFYCLRQLWDEVVDLRFDENLKELPVPTLIFQGDHDKNTPTILVEEWFEKLKAPYKKYISFKESAHSPIKEEPELFATELINNLEKL